MKAIFSVCSKGLVCAFFLMACSHLSANSKGAAVQTQVNEKTNKILVKKDGKESSFSLNLPKGFEVESVFKQSDGKYEVVAYQYSNGEEAGSQIQVIDSQAMKLLWKKEIPGFNLAQPLIEKGFIYYAVVDYVAKFEIESGKVVWEKEDVNASHGFIGSEKIEIKDGDVIFSESLKIQDKDGKVKEGGN